MDGAALTRALESGGWHPLADRARLGLSGADRLRYLNGQVSNDLRKLQPGVVMQACILSAKGRLDAVVWIWAEAERLVVECDASQRDALAMRLEKYIVADDVLVESIDIANEFHVFGPAARAGEPLRNIERLGMPGGDFAAPLPSDEASPEILEYLRVAQRVPRWGAELGPETLPAEAGLDRTAVDFHKGCYIGQEVVSRVESVGRVNRRLFVFEVLEGAVPLPGARVVTADSGRESGVVTSIAPQFALYPAIGLCYIRRETDPSEPLVADSARIQLRQPECVS